jgi:hypothetical protein
MNTERSKRLQSQRCTPNRLGMKSPDLQDGPRVRDWLTIKECALALDISHSTLRKQIDWAFHSVDGFPFPGGAENPRNPWFRPIEEILVIHGPHTRRFSIPALELHRYPGAVRTRILRLAAQPPADHRTVGRRQTAVEPAVVPRGIIPGSTADRVLDVIRTDPSRGWSLPEIIDKLEERGQLPVSSNPQNPRNVLQATLFRLTWETRHLERIGFGLYRLASHSGFDRMPLRRSRPVRAESSRKTVRVSDLSGR